MAVDKNELQPLKVNVIYSNIEDDAPVYHEYTN